MCGSRVLTLDQVPISLGEMGGPTIGFWWSEQTPVEPLVAFKCDANIVRIYPWAHGIYRLLCIVQ